VTNLSLAKQLAELAEPLDEGERDGDTVVCP
jgi:hypothetical protein